MIWKIYAKTPPMLIFLIITVGVFFGAGAYTFWYGMGYSYLLDDPVACTNCHIMRDSFDSWSVSSHRNVTCNDCHVPHAIIGKYTAKIENGFRHSKAFTFDDIQVLRITQKNLRNLQDNCRRCHEPMVSMILRGGSEPEISCTRCHQGAGHVF